jgi:hypothetical protein
VRFFVVLSFRSRWTSLIVGLFVLLVHCRGFDIGKRQANCALQIAERRSRIRPDLNVAATGLK